MWRIYVNWPVNIEQTLDILLEVSVLSDKAETPIVNRTALGSIITGRSYLLIFTFILMAGPPRSMWFEISHFCWMALSSADKLKPITLSCKCHVVNHLINCMRKYWESNTGKETLSKASDNMYRYHQKTKSFYKHSGKHSFMEKSKFFRLS